MSNREETLKAMEGRIDNKHFVEAPLPYDVRTMIGLQYTRQWKLRSNTDYHLVWDSKKRVMCVFNPGNVKLTDDEWLDAMTIENHIPTPSAASDEEGNVE